MKAVRAYVAVHRAPCEPGLMRESERARARMFNVMGLYFNLIRSMGTFRLYYNVMGT